VGRSYSVSSVRAHPINNGMLAESAGPAGSHGWLGRALPSTIGEFAVIPGSRRVIFGYTAAFASRSRAIGRDCSSRVWSRTPPQMFHFSSALGKSDPGLLSKIDPAGLRIESGGLARTYALGIHPPPELPLSADRMSYSVVLGVTEWARRSDGVYLKHGHRRNQHTGRR
jgi:hypothetical protein